MYLKKNSFDQQVQNKHFDRKNFFFEEFILDFEKKIVTIKNCVIIILIIAKRYFRLIVSHVINFNNVIVISLHSQTIIKIYHLNFSKMKDFFFKSNNINFSMYIHVISDKITDVLMRNDENKFMKIFWYFRLKCVMKMNFSNAYQINKEIINLIKKNSKRHIERHILINCFGPV